MDTLYIFAGEFFNIYEEQFEYEYEYLKLFVDVGVNSMTPYRVFKALGDAIQRFINDNKDAILFFPSTELMLYIQCDDVQQNILPIYRTTHGSITEKEIISYDEQIGSKAKSFIKYFKESLEDFTMLKINNYRDSIRYLTISIVALYNTIKNITKYHDQYDKIMFNIDWLILSSRKFTSDDESRNGTVTLTWFNLDRKYHEVELTNYKKA